MKEIIEKIIVLLQQLLKMIPAVSGAPGEKPDYIVIAEKEIGIREMVGGENKRIVEYHATTKLKATEDEVPWCASFVNWVLEQTGYERSHMAAARSFLAVNTKLKGYEKYSIVVFKRGNSTWQGHVAFAVDRKDGFIRCLGGNQSNAVSYASYKESDVLGYIRPKKLGA